MRGIFFLLFTYILYCTSVRTIYHAFSQLFSGYIIVSLAYFLYIFLVLTTLPSCTVHKCHSLHNFLSISVAEPERFDADPDTFQDDADPEPDPNFV